MSGGIVKVTYSIKNVVLIIVLIIFFLAMDVLSILIVPNMIMNIAMTAIIIFLTIYFIYLALNRIKEISVCTVILIGFSYLKVFLVEERLNNIKSKFFRMVLNGLSYLVCIALTIALGVAIYKIFNDFDIDLSKIKV